MIVVTGGAGSIGSNLVKALNERGEQNILVVDNLEKGEKFINLADCEIADYCDKRDFLGRLKDDRILADSITAIFHQGACSATTEWDGHYMMKNNYEYSKKLLHFCLDRNVQFIYASSASVYGMGSDFKEDPRYEKPLNVYAFSKHLFDKYVRRVCADAKSQVVGLRYFNVYGSREQHKGSMASVAFHFSNQIKAQGYCKLFEGCDGYDDGGQLRDFIYVDDAIKVNLWFLDNPKVSGIYNTGTGKAQSFNDVARAVIDWHGRGGIEYIPFPEHLKGHYQSYTEANISLLRDSGYASPFSDVNTGVQQYMDTLHRSK